MAKKHPVKAPGPGGKSRKTIEQAAYGDEHLQSVHNQVSREKEEPTEGFSPTPIFIIFLCCALTFWGGVYITKYRAEFDPMQYDENYVADGKAPTGPVFDPVKRGKQLYNNNCAACHQASGLGVAGAFPPLAESNWVLGDPARSIKILLLGLQGPIEVNGSEYNGNMPSYGAWKDRDIAAVVSHVRTNFGNADTIVEEAAVTEIRESLERTSPWSGSELLAEHPLQ